MSSRHSLLILAAAVSFTAAHSLTMAQVSPAAAPPVTPASAAYPVIPIYTGAAPGALAEGDDHTPTLTIYAAAADKATGAGIVICPGGGYGGLAAHEGEGYAKWLAERGITGMVLKYRLGSKGYRHPIMLQDVARAIRLARSHATEWKIDPTRIGVMGSSAGGHLASTILTHFDAGNAQAADPVDRLSSRPDLGVLCYPVITMGGTTHSGSRNNLLGKEPAPELIELLSNEKQVTKETPPCFVWHTWEDKAVVVQNAILFGDALRAAGVPFELHIYEKGQHGIGLGGGRNGGVYHRWTHDLEAWLKERGWVK